MPFTIYESLINLIVLGVHVFVEVVAVCMLFLRHRPKHDRAWRWMAAFFAMSAFASIAEMFLIVVAEEGHGPYMLLDPKVVICGFLTFAFLMFYVMELLRPKWLNVKRVILIVLPWVVCVLLLVVSYFLDKELVVLHSYEDLRQHLHVPEIWIRIVLSVLFVPYAISLFYFRYNWKYSTVSRMFANIMTALTILMCFTYILSRGFMWFPAYLMHQTIYIALTIFFVYVEYNERFHVPESKADKIDVDADEDNVVPHQIETTIVHAAHVLETVMIQPQVWQNPDFSVSELARIVGTNSTYLQKAAKEMGYASVMDMLHHIRINYVREQLLADPTLAIQDVFYDAGYRSRSTAWRHFVNIVQCTPTEFVAQNTPPHTTT